MKGRDARSEAGLDAEIGRPGIELRLAEAIRDIVDRRVRLIADIERFRIPTRDQKSLLGRLVDVTGMVGGR